MVQCGYCVLGTTNQSTREKGADGQLVVACLNLFIIINLYSPVSPIKRHLVSPEKFHKP